MVRTSKPPASMMLAMDHRIPNILQLLPLLFSCVKKILISFIGQLFP